MIRRAGLYSLLLTIVVFMLSCHSERGLIKAPVKEAEPEYLTSQLKKHQLKFNSFKAKFSLRYTKGSDKSNVKGNIRVKKDSVIWVSIAPMLGIEIARIKITPDSVKFINRHNKSYFKADYNYINRYLNSATGFEMLQALLIGNDFSSYEDAGWEVKIDDGLYRLSTVNRRKEIKYVSKGEASVIPFQKTWLDPENFKVKKVMVKEASSSRSRELIASYNDFSQISQQLFPLHVEYNLEANENINVILDYSRVSLDENLKYPFNISSKYKKLRIPE